MDLGYMYICIVFSFYATRLRTGEQSSIGCDSISLFFCSFLCFNLICSLVDFASVQFVDGLSRLVFSFFFFTINTHNFLCSMTLSVAAAAQHKVNIYFATCFFFLSVRRQHSSFRHSHSQCIRFFCCSLLMALSLFNVSKQ